MLVLPVPQSPVCFLVPLFPRFKCVPLFPSPQCVSQFPCSRVSSVFLLLCSKCRPLFPCLLSSAFPSFLGQVAACSLVPSVFLSFLVMWFECVPQLPCCSSEHVSFISQFGVYFLVDLFPHSLVKSVSLFPCSQCLSQFRAFPLVFLVLGDSSSAHVFRVPLIVSLFPSLIIFPSFLVLQDAMYFLGPSVP